MKTRPQKTITAALILAPLFALNGQTRSYSYDFEADTLGVAFSDSATFNYSNDNASTTLSAGGTLVFRGNSSGSDYEVVTIGGTKTLRIQGGLNTQTDDFGVYIGGLDFSDYVSGDEKLVTFSFDILGNSLVSADNWEVNYTLASSLAGHTGFVDDAFTGKTVFSFANSGSTMTTVSGSFTVPDGSGSTIGGLFISGPRNLDGSAALASGGGSLALDNISVAVIPEPETFATIFGIAALMLLVVRRR